MVGQLDDLLARGAAASPWSVVASWTGDPRQLLEARHGALGRIRWLETKAEGRDPGAFARTEPTPAEVVAHFREATGLYCTERLVSLFQGAAGRASAALEATRADVRSRLRAYDSLSQLTGSWEENERSLAALEGRERDLVAAVARLAPVADGMIARHRDRAREVVAALDLKAVTLGLTFARGLEDRRPIASAAIDELMYRLHHIESEVASAPLLSRGGLRRALEAEIRASLAEATRAIEEASAWATGRTAASLEPEVLKAAETPAAWRKLGEELLAHPDRFPPDLLARWDEPVAASFRGVDAALVLEALPGFGPRVPRPGDAIVYGQRGPSGATPLPLPGVIVAVTGGAGSSAVVVCSQQGTDPLPGVPFSPVLAVDHWSWPDGGAADPASGEALP